MALTANDLNNDIPLGRSLGPTWRDVLRGARINADRTSSNHRLSRREQ